MKNITNANSGSVLTLLSVLLLLQTGCSSTTIPEPVASPGSNMIPDDILSHYDMSNLAGIMYPRKELYSIITHVLPATNQTNWDGTQSWGEANFADADGNPMNIGTVYFNKEWDNIPVQSGPSGLYSYSGSDLPLYTDGLTKNTVRIVPANGFSKSATASFTFAAMPSITNIVRGQNISRDSNITVNWTGTGSDYVSVNVFCWDSTGTNDTVGKGFGVGANFKNTGTATIPAHPAQLHLGLADVEVCRFQPQFITLSNGKRVAIICKTCEEITVHIVD